LRRAWRGISDDQGTELVEYAIVLIVLLTFLLGIMDFSRLLYTYHFVSEVAREGARYAIVRGSTFGTTACTSTSTFACNASAANVMSYVQSLTPPGINSAWSTGCPSSTPCVGTTWPGTAPSGAATACSTTNGNNSPGCLVQVVVNYPFKFIFPFMPSSASTWTVASTSVMVISQ
jgi:Flp pilus assembly protein TadG